MSTERERYKVLTDVVAATEGKKIVGRTRLQKIICLLQMAGAEFDYDFEYKHYGPYCEALADDMDYSCIFGEVTEKRKKAGWGGVYSIYSTESKPENSDFLNGFQKRILDLCSGTNSNAIDLELAVTAAWLKQDGETDPWGKVATLKWEKADRIESAKALYAKIKAFDTDNKLPVLQA